MHLLFNTGSGGGLRARGVSTLECHERLIYFALHKLTNGRLFQVRTGGQNFKASGAMRRMRDALMRHSLCAAPAVIMQIFNEC